MNIKHWWIIGILMFMLPLPAWAATYYVRLTAGSGHSCGQAQTDNDANARNTITSGAQCLSPGDTLIVHGGNYDEYVGPDGGAVIPGGSSNNYVTIRAASGEVVRVLKIDIRNSWIELDGINIDAGYTQDEGLSIAGSHIIVRNMELTGAKGGAIGSDEGRDDYQFLNLNIHHNGIKPDGTVTCEPCAGLPPGPDCNPSQRGYCHGTYISNVTNVVIRGGNYSFNEGYGIHNGNPGEIVDGIICVGNHQGCKLQRFNNNAIMTNNVIYSQDEHGLVLAGGGHKIFNNTIFGNPQYGIVWLTGGGGEVRNNIIMNNGDSISTPESSSTFSNNLCNNIGDGCTLSGTAANTFANAPGNDFHLKPGSPAINTGITLIGLISDIEGNVRPEPGGSALDVGAYECQALIGSGGDCANAVPPPNLGLVVEHKTNGTDTSGNAFPAATLTGGTLTNGSPLTSNNPTAFVFDGTNDAMIEANDAAFRSAEFCWAVWVNSSTLPAPGEVARFMSLGTAVVFGWRGDDGKLFGYINNGAVEVVDSVSVINGSTHLIGLSFGDGFLRGWKDNANFLSVPFAGAISYVGNEQMTYGGVPTKYGAARANNFRVFDRACDPQDMQTIYDERVSQIGTTSTHWLFSQPDSAEITLIAGQGVDAPNITLNRSAEVLQSWNIKRNGSTTALHHSLECSLNSLVTFVTLTTSCASNPACIANDSVKNSGDATADVDGLPNDGFTFVPGMYEVDSVGAFTTTLLDGQVTKWRYGLAFNQSLADQDIVRCRVAGMDSYPATLPTITISVPIPSTGSDLKGGTFIGVTVK